MTDWHKHRHQIVHGGQIAPVLPAGDANGASPYPNDTRVIPSPQDANTVSAKPDGICPWCRATFPVDSMRNRHMTDCPMRPEGNR